MSYIKHPTVLLRSPGTDFEPFSATTLVMATTVVRINKK